MKRILLLAFALTGMAFAQSGLYINGIVSAGWIKSEGNNFLVESTNQTGNFQNMEAALSILALPSDKLRVGMQVFARDLGDVGNLDFYLDWAYGAYSFNDALGVQAGRFKANIGQYNKFRDVETAKPVSVLPQSIYSEQIRDLMIAVNGVGLYGNVDLGSAGTLNYELSGGMLNADPNGLDSYINRELKGFKNRLGDGIAATTLATYHENGLTNLTSDDISVTVHDLLDVDITDNEIYNLGVGVDTSFGLKVGLSASYIFLNYFPEFSYTMSVDLGTSSTTFQPLDDTVSGTQSIAGKSILPGFYVASLEYSSGSLLLAGEAMYRVWEDYQNGQRDGDSPRENFGYYGLASYQVNDALSVASYYSSLIRDFEQGDDASAGEYNNDLALSLSYALDSSWLLRLEAHAVEGYFFINSDVNEGDRNERWQYYVVKSTYSF